MPAFKLEEQNVRPKAGNTQMYVVVMRISRPLKMQSGNRRCVVVDAQEKAVTKSQKRRV